MTKPQCPSISRRRFLELSGLAGLASLSPSFLYGRPDDFITVSIFHTTDLHGHILPTVDYSGVPDLGGLARCASQIKFWRRKHPNSCLIDLGDTYQGTAFSIESKGATMIDCLNALHYDGWVIGNHEFDWGEEPIRNAIERFSGKSLAANVTVDGRSAFDNSPVEPYILKEIAGFKIGILGLTTPGLLAWFRPELLGPYRAEDCVEPSKRAVTELKELGADAIVVGAHMGLARDIDDFGNQLGAVTAANPEIVACLGGHTHRDVPNARVNGVVFSQASFHGIHVGRLDLTFDRAKRQLLHIQPVTTLMDSAIQLDPTILSLTEEDRERSDSRLATEIGFLAEPLSVVEAPGQPSDLAQLLGRGLAFGSQSAGHPVDGVYHGTFTFGSREPIPAGKVTIGDCWRLMPYENMIFIAELSPSEIKEVMDENYSQSNQKSLMGIRVTVTGRGRSARVENLFDHRGEPLDAHKRYRIAMNSYDASSGGRRLRRLAELTNDPQTSPRMLKGTQTRNALIDYFTEQQKVHITGEMDWPFADSL